MFNLTLYLRFCQVNNHFCRATKDKTSSLNRFMLVAYCFSSLIFLSFTASANYTPMIQNPSDGYTIRIESNNPIAATPIGGTDGKSYYQVGSPIVIDISNAAASVTGIVKCFGRVWGNSGTNITTTNAFHRLFMTAPEAGTLIGGKKAYRINNNVVMTVEAKAKMDEGWVAISASRACSGMYITPTQLASQFNAQFPFTFIFYINELIVDGQVMINQMDLGGYVRAFMSPEVAPTETNWPIGQTTVPMRLAAAQLNFASSCTTMTSTGQAGTVNLRHGQLNSVNYDNLITEKVFYTCKFARATDVKLKLDYTSDDDSQKRLPMVNSLDNTKKIYSELKITDESTGQSGTDIKVSIEDLKTITISSHIQGTNAAPGDYRGSAWLIATFD